MDNIQRRRCQAERMGGSDLESKLVRCAVVGLGQGMHDVNVITHHPRMSLVAVCDTDIERYEWLTGARPIEDATSDLAQQPGYRALVQSLCDRPYHWASAPPRRQGAQGMRSSPPRSTAPSSRKACTGST